VFCINVQLQGFCNHTTLTESMASLPQTVMSDTALTCLFHTAPCSLYEPYLYKIHPNITKWHQNAERAYKVRCDRSLLP
jgi:hypothetical protein